MKRRKQDLKKEQDDLFNESIVKVNIESSDYFFEVGNDATNDIAEAVAMMMRNVSLVNDSIWDMDIKKIKHEDITPEKALFWLTGGYTEWRTLEHYNRPWCDCYLDFQEEFGFLVVNIIKRSKKMRDVRENFIKYLNLPVLYDFAMSRDMLK